MSRRVSPRVSIRDVPVIRPSAVSPTRRAGMTMQYDRLMSPAQSRQMHVSLGVDSAYYTIPGQDLDVRGKLIQLISKYLPDVIDVTNIVDVSVSRVDSYKDPGHGGSHLYEATALALSLIRPEDRPNVVILAALCHDIKDSKFVVAGAPDFVVSDFLMANGVDAETSATVDAIVNNISWNKESKAYALMTPQQIEDNYNFQLGTLSAIPDGLPIELDPVQDADRILASGYIGAMRTFLYRGAKQMPGDPIMGKTSQHLLAYERSGVMPPDFDILRSAYLASVVSNSGMVGHYLAKLSQLPRFARTAEGKRILDATEVELNNFTRGITNEWSSLHSRTFPGKFGFGLLGVKSTQQVKNLLEAALSLKKAGVIQAPIMVDAAMAYGVGKYVGEAFDTLEPADAAQFQVVTKVNSTHEKDIAGALTQHLYGPTGLEKPESWIDADGNAIPVGLMGKLKKTPLYAILLHNPGRTYGKFEGFTNNKLALENLHRFTQTLSQKPLCGICNVLNVGELLNDYTSIYTDSNGVKITRYHGGYGDSIPLIDIVQAEFVPGESNELIALLQDAGVELMRSRPFSDGKADPATYLGIVKMWTGAGIGVIPSISHRAAVLDDPVAVEQRMRSYFP